MTTQQGNQKERAGRASRPERVLLPSKVWNFEGQRLRLQLEERMT